MLDQNKKRIFDFPKIEYTLRTVNSIINSCNIALNFFKEIKIKLIITDDNSTKENLEKINNLIIKANFETSIINHGKNEFSDQTSPYRFTLPDYGTLAEKFKSGLFFHS